VFDSRVRRKTLQEHVRDRTFRAERHRALVPEERPDEIDLTSWIRLLRRIGRRDEARALVAQRIRERLASR
jgi:hypothetical protein